LCLFKTVIRYLLGYKWEQIVLEILFENEFLAWITGRVQSFTIKSFEAIFHPPLESEAPLDEFLRFLISLLVGSVGIKANHVTKLVSGMSTAATALDKFQFADYVNQIYAYFSEDNLHAKDLLRFRHSYPSTMLFIDTHSRIIDVQHDRVATVEETRHLISYYAGYLKELPRYSEADSKVLRPMLAGPINYVTRLGVAPLENCRREPAHFVFSGPPGIGKSTVIDRIVRACAKYVNTPLSECVFHVNPSDAYASKYRFQDVWVFDELFQAADSEARPSIDISLLFKLITKTPVTLNMAAVEDKGTIAQCNLVLSGCNVQFRPNHNNTIQLRPYIKSVNSVEAVRRRLTYIVLPQLRPEYQLIANRIVRKDTKLPLDVEICDHSVTHYFHILGAVDKPILNPFSAEETCRFSYPDLLRFITREYHQCRNYAPKETAEDDLAHCYQPEGYEWVNNFRKSTTDIIRRGFGPTLNRCLCTYATGTVRSTPQCHKSLGVYRNKLSRYLFDNAWDYPTGHEIFSRDQNIVRANLQIKNDNAYYEDRLVRIFHSWDLLQEELTEHPTTRHWTSRADEAAYTPLGPICFGYVENEEIRYVLVRFYTVNTFEAKHSAADEPFQPEEDPNKVNIVPLILNPIAAFFAAFLITTVVLKSAAFIAEKIASYNNRYKLYDETVVYHAESGEIITNASLHPDKRVKIHGRFFVKRFSKRTQKEEWYPEGLEAENTDSHFERQIPTICNSLYALSVGGSYIGNGFISAEACLIMPTHLTHYLKNASVLTMRREAFIKEVLLSVEDVPVFTVIPAPDVADLSIIHFHRSAVGQLSIPGSRKQLTKFSTSPPSSGKAINYLRNMDGTLQTTVVTYATSETTEGYLVDESSITHSPAGSRIVDVNSASGWCGSLYLDETQPSSPIIGMHVASNKRGRGLMVLCKTVATVPFPIPVGNVYPADPTAPFCGFTETSIAPVHVYQPTNKKITSRFFPTLTPAYAMSRLHPFSVGGVKIDPGISAFQRFNDVTHRAPSRTISIRPAAIALSNIMKTNYSTYPLPTWEDTITGGGECPSIDGSKSSGWPHGGPKNLFLWRDEEKRPIPSAELLTMLDSVIETLAPEDFASMDPSDFEDSSSIVKGCLKDEPTKLSKLDLKSRLFGISEIREFLIQRRFFFDLAINFTSKNLLFCSALGLAPDDFPLIHEHLSAVGPGGFVVAADFTDMDMHVSEEDLLVCLLFWFQLRGYDNGPVRRKVDPLYPPLSRSDFLRYRIVRRLANYIYIYRNRFVAPGQGHPSGSFLTTIINITLQILTWSRAYSLVLGISVEQFFSQTRMVFLGDDSLIALPAHFAHVDMPKIRSTMLQMGYVITGEVKTAPPVLQNMWDGQGLSDYSFLSRRFFRRPDGTIVAPLDPERCRKMVCFVDPKHELENMPAQFLAFADELQRYVGVPTDAHELLLTQGTDLIRQVFHCSIPEFLEMDQLDRVTHYRNFVILQNNFSAEGPGDSETTTALGGNDAASPTTFVEDTVTDTITAQDEYCESWRDSGMELENHLEGRVFSRPFNYSTFAWGVFSAGIVQTSYFPSAYFQNNFNAQAKLANYCFLRGVMCIRAVMTSTPYTSGKLLMSVRPAMRPPGTVVAATGDPCVELDAASGKSATIKIPCVMPAGWAAIESFSNTPAGTWNPLFDWCSFSLSVVASLKDPSLPTVNIQLYAWLEEVELKGPGVTSFTLAPQGPSGSISSSSKSSSSSSSSSSPVTSTPTPVEAGVIRVIQGAHRAVKTIGGLLVDSSVMIKNALTVAALVGLSDPSMLDNTTIVANISHFDAPHMFGKSPALVMAADQSTKIVIPYGSFSLSADGMDIVRYASRMALLGTAPWTALNVTGDEILSLPINPATKSSFAVLPDVVSGYTPLSYACQMFRFWRGSIRYRFALAKTRFHAGIIEIVWQMGRCNTPLTDDAHATICYRAVWDIQESESFEVTVPYVSPLPWQPNYASTFRTTTPTTSSSRPSGFIRIRVVNPLLASNNLASDTVDLVVYTAAGPDFQLALPCLPTAYLYEIPAAKKPTRSRISSSSKIPFQAEGGGNPGVFQMDETDGLESANPPFLMAPSTPISPIGLTACIGENIPNFRLLLRRFGGHAQSASAVSTIYHLGSLVWASTNTNGHPFFTALLATYAFYAGGFRISVNTTTTTNVSIAYLDITALGTARATTTPDQFCVYGVPYHHLVPFQYCRNAQVNAANPISIVIGPSFPVVANQHIYSLSTADDFSFGWQIGPELANLSPTVIEFEDIVGELFPTFS
jgi:hypothetical protein